MYLRGKVWWTQFKRNGKLIRLSTGTKDKGEAKKKEAEFIIDFDKHGLKNEGKKKTFRDMTDRYMQEYAPQKAPKSMVRDSSSLKHLLPVFGNMPLIQITPDHIARFKTKRRNEGAAPKTINHELGFCKHAFNLAIREWDWVSVNPFYHVAMEKLPLPRVRYLTRDEFDRLYHETNYRLKPIIVIAVHTGMRLGNILGLTWQEVDLTRGVITLEHTKNGERLGLPMNGTVKNLLVQLNKIRHIKSPYVFPTSTGTKFDNSKIGKWFRDACKKTGIQDFRFHDLRHTFASWLVQADVNLYNVQKLLGHKDFKMTQRYAHLAPDNLKNSVAVLDQIQGRVITIGDHSGEIQ